MTQVRTNDVNNANTNRHVRFHVGHAAAVAGTFMALQGPAHAYPYYGKVQSPTLAQQLAQLRLSLIARVAARYAILVGVEVASDLAGANYGAGIVLTYEQDEMGVFFNNAWPATVVGGGAITGKHTAGNIADTVGIGGMTTPKTKPGLDAILNDLDGVSYDGGATGPFDGVGVNVTLPDGQLATGAALDGTGLVVTYLEPTVV